MSCFKGKYKDKLLIQELVGRKNRTIRMGPPLPLSSSIPSTCCLQGAQNVFDWPAGDGSLLPGVGSLVCADPCPSGKVRCWSHPGRQRPPPPSNFSQAWRMLSNHVSRLPAASAPLSFSTSPGSFKGRNGLGQFPPWNSGSAQPFLGVLLPQQRAGQDSGSPAEE